ncbi:hypothetical protein ABGT15_04545 [Flavobacterium enshiense]|uniref:hypothetical protein n=1 Tax=Flavobacterium enshiense TaxID=1341165 RepID=UPI00345C7704
MGNIKLGINTISNIKLGANQVQKVYLGSNLIRSFTNYSTELQAIINKANSEGFTVPNSTTLGYIDTLIGSMKSAGVWNKQDRIYNFAFNNTGLTNFSRIEWKNPTISPLLTLNGGITYQVGGFEGNAVDGYIDTGFIPSTNGVNYTQNNASRTAVIYTAPSSGNVLDGNSPTGNNGMFLNNSASHRINATNNLNTIANISGTGLKSINRDNSTDLRLYSSSTEYVRTETTNTFPILSQYILRNTTSYGDSVVSNYMLGASLSSTEISNLRGAYNTYLISLGLSAIA